MQWRKETTAIQTMACGHKSPSFPVKGQVIPRIPPTSSFPSRPRLHRRITNPRATTGLSRPTVLAFLNSTTTTTTVYLMRLSIPHQTTA